MDVGANKTDWSRMAIEIFPRAYFVLIEPQEEIKELLEGFQVKHPRSNYFLAGAGPENGVLTLNVWDDLSGSSFLPERGYVVYDFSGFLRRPFDNALARCDVAFVKQNGFLRKSNKWS